ncbi:MAG: CHASE domain-containing protein [Planctomycetota bacterium]
MDKTSIKIEDRLTDRTGDERAVAPSRVWVVLVLMVGLVATGIGYWTIRDLHGRALESRFRKLAEERVFAVQRTIDDHLHTLIAMASFFRSSNHVTREEFVEFVSPLLGYQPGIQALEWIPRVGRVEREAYERRAREEGWPGFKFRVRDGAGSMVESPEREEYYPVYYLEPYGGNEAALGFDLGSNEVRREALTESASTGQMRATSRVRLVQEMGAQYGVLIFYPLYESDTRLDKPDQREQSLLGFVLGVFRICDMKDAAMSNFYPGGVDLEIWDISAAPGERFLTRHRSRTGPALEDESDRVSSVEPGGLVSGHVIEVADRQWAVRCVAAPTFYEQNRSAAPTLVLLVGLILTGALSLYARFLTLRATDIQKMVVQRTSQLHEQSRLLEKEIGEHMGTLERLEDLNRSLVQSNEELEEKNEEILQLAFAITHDLKTPLATLGGALDLLHQRLRGELDEELRGWLDRLPRSVDRMSQMLDGLMHYAQAGALTLRGDRVDLGRQVAHVADEFNRELVGGRIRVEIEGEGLMVAGERDIVRRVLCNVIGNSVKFRRPGVWCEVDIRLSRVRGMVRLEVRDNGLGIDPEKRDQVFLPFKRATTRVEGTGLGLSIVKRFVDGCGGAVWIESEGVSGTTVVLDLPEQHETEQSYKEVPCDECTTSLDY